MKQTNVRSVIRTKGGFTLLEVLVALAVTGIALTVIYQLFSGNLKNISASEDYVAATTAGETKLREFLAEQTLGEGTWTQTTEEGYVVEIHSTEVLKERTENLQVRAFDIDLTLRWKRGGRERSIHLRTLELAGKGSAVPITGA